MKQIKIGFRKVAFLVLIFFAGIIIYGFIPMKLYSMWQKNFRSQHKKELRTEKPLTNAEDSTEIIHPSQSK